MADPKGKFIVFEGVDGAGKSTQAYLLVKHLTDLKIRVVPTREPGGTGLGERVREILLDPREEKIAASCELFLYMASRAQLVSEVIRPSLEQGFVVVSERFSLSSVAYQGYAGGLPAEAIRQVSDIATGGLEPDLTIVLDVAPEEATRREKMGGASYDRIEKKGVEYQKKVRQGFLDLAAANPVKIKVVDASRQAKVVAEEVKRLVDGVIR